MSRSLMLLGVFIAVGLILASMAGCASLPLTEYEQGCHDALDLFRPQTDPDVVRKHCSFLNRGRQIRDRNSEFLHDISVGM